MLCINNSGLFGTIIAFVIILIFRMKQEFQEEICMRQAIVIFTKIPEAGKVKTRLTKESGGILTPEEAKLFYEAGLYDMLETCTGVDNVDVWICHNADGDRAYLNTMIMQLNSPQNIAGIFKDIGGTYEENLLYAAYFLLKPGQKNKLAQSVLIVEGNACDLEINVLQEAINKMDGWAGFLILKQQASKWKVLSLARM
jgi:glycosyltransferase A (GT-A) superfamily protein (DUF2064 family)